MRAPNCDTLRWREEHSDVDGCQHGKVVGGDSCQTVVGYSNLHEGCPGFYPDPVQSKHREKRRKAPSRRRLTQQVVQAVESKSPGSPLVYIADDKRQSVIPFLLAQYLDQ